MSIDRKEGFLVQQIVGAPKDLALMNNWPNVFELFLLKVHSMLKDIAKCGRNFDIMGFVHPESVHAGSCVRIVFWLRRGLVIATVLRHMTEQLPQTFPMKSGEPI
jgi:hypothetical protein